MLWTDGKEAQNWPDIWGHLKRIIAWMIRFHLLSTSNKTLWAGHFPSNFSFTLTTIVFSPKLSKFFFPNINYILWERQTGPESNCVVHKRVDPFGGVGTKITRGIPVRTCKFFPSKNEILLLPFFSSSKIWETAAGNYINRSPPPVQHHIIRVIVKSPGAHDSKRKKKEQQQIPPFTHWIS